MDKTTRIFLIWIKLANRFTPAQYVICHDLAKQICLVKNKSCSKLLEMASTSIKIFSWLFEKIGQKWKKRGSKLSKTWASYIILNKVGKNEKGSCRMEINWYRTGVLVEKMPTIEEEEIPISWFPWVEIPSSGVAFMQV